MKQKPSVTQKKAKYTLTGNLHIVHYCTSEAISLIGIQFHINAGKKVPRMHTWSSNVVIMSKDVDEILSEKTVATYNLNTKKLVT